MRGFLSENVKESTKEFLSESVRESTRGFLSENVKGFLSENVKESMKGFLSESVRGNTKGSFWRSRTVKLRSGLSFPCLLYTSVPWFLPTVEADRINRMQPV